MYNVLLYLIIIGEACEFYYVFRGLSIEIT